jgi:hypothetical protein
MNRKPPILCIWICTALLLGFVLVYIYAVAIDPLYKNPMRRLSVSDNINLTVTKHWGWGGSVIFYNQDLPYLRNISYGLAKGEHENIGGFDFCGIHFWRFQTTTMPKIWWTLMFSLWYPIAICAVCLLICMRYQMRRNAPRDHLVSGRIG